MKKSEEIVAEDVRRIAEAAGTDTFKSGRILVTGGAGFIGSYICEALLSCGAEIDCVDDFSTGTRENLAAIVQNRNLRLVNEDILQFGKTSPYAFIFHLASRASPEDYQLHPIETLTVNAQGSHRILEIARKCDATVLFTSTSEVYGNAQRIPTPEDYWGNVNPIGPRSCYDEGKRFAEALFMSYYRQYGLNIRIIRVHNTYGPRLRADGAYARVVSRFTIQASNGEPLTIYGDGSQTRSFCYISDTSRALLKAIVADKAKGEVVNVGSTIETTINELAEKIIRLTGSKSKKTFLPLREDDPPRRCPDVTKAKQILHWTPEVGLEEGLKRTICWFKTQGTD
jgi:UDP-glucuronate decarboxylase